MNCFALIAVGSLTFWGKPKMGRTQKTVQINRKSVSHEKSTDQNSSTGSILGNTRIYAKLLWIFKCQ